jgi:murein L,D-transpeptidase YafK
LQDIFALLIKKLKSLNDSKVFVMNANHFLTKIKKVNLIAMIIKVLLRYYILISVFLLLLPAAALANLSPRSENIPDSILSLASGYVIVVDKQYQKMYVFHKNGYFSKVFDAPCSTGKKPGAKQVSGDAKTPNGIFFATKILRNPGPLETYGSFAFQLDYPTLSDKKAGRNGSNIWIHGTTKQLLPSQSNGCVVLSNSDLQRLTDIIFLNKTPVIIAESINWVSPNRVSPTKDELEIILMSWNKALTEGDIKNIDSLYLQGSEIKGKSREALINKIKSMKHLNKHFVLQPRDVSILKQDNNAVIMFDQIIAVNRDNSFQGSYSKLVLEKINNNWYIIDDVTTPDKKLVQIDSSQDPSKSTAYEPVRYLITKWVNSWTSGDMVNYRNCYAANFQSKGMSLNDWVSHKANVRRNSKIISISIDNLRISADANTATAVFIQQYDSSTLKSKGKKKLELKKINGEWKIYREIM